MVTALYNRFAVGFSYTDYHLIVSTAEFFNRFLVSAWENERVAILSYPRVNYLYEQIKKNGIEYHEKLKRILYMPTHRSYGHGSLNPLIFKDSEVFREFLAENNFELKYRFHPNMVRKSLEELGTDYIENNFDKHSDAQDALLEADILISDYSSCVYDYLVCDKPIVFFHYDNYVTDDNPLYYDVESLNLGPIAKTEDELEHILTKLITDAHYYNELVKNIVETKKKYIKREYSWEDYDSFFINNK